MRKTNDKRFDPEVKSELYVSEWMEEKLPKLLIGIAIACALFALGVGFWKTFIYKPVNDPMKDPGYTWSATPYQSNAMVSGGANLEDDGPGEFTEPTPSKVDSVKDPAADPSNQVNTGNWTTGSSNQVNPEEAVEETSTASATRQSRRLPSLITLIASSRSWLYY